jgi:hypothetical protein
MQSKTPPIDKEYLFDYGQMVIEVRYLSGTRLQWQQLKGPQAGLKGEETYASAEVRPNVFFVWWQEKDTSIVTQVVDFEKGSVFTTWTSKDKQLSAFQGKVAPKR